MRGKTLRARICKLYVRVGGRQSDQWKYAGVHNNYHAAIATGKTNYGHGNFLIVVDHHRNSYAPTREEQLPIAGAVESHIKRMVSYGIQNSPSFCSDKDN